jgi:hypothetical protein
LAVIIDGKGGDTVAIEVRITCGDIVGSGVVIGISGVNCADDCTVRTGFRNTVAPTAILLAMVKVLLVITGG